MKIDQASATALGVSTLAAAILWGAALMASKDAQATPAYAKQTGKPCAFCHTAVPALNERGKKFTASGYKSWE